MNIESYFVESRNDESRHTRGLSDSSTAEMMGTETVMAKMTIRYLFSNNDDEQYVDVEQ